MTVREATVEDCEIIAEIHIQSFRDFFLSTLGKRFLRSFYKACIKCPGAITVIACSQTGEIVGFALASLSGKHFYRTLLFKNLHVFFMEGVILLFSKPGALLRLAMNLSKSGGDSTGAAELLSIASLPAFKGQGVGKLLITAVEERLKQHNIKGITLTTDYDNNEQVIGFYKSCGYVIVSDFITYPGRRMYRMTKSLG